MLTIRLQLAGKRNLREYRIVLAQKTAAAGKKFVEVLGHYNPHTKAFTVKNQDRLKYWIEQHVELSPTIHNLFVEKNVISEKKKQAFRIPKPEAKPEEAAPAQAVAAEPAPVAEAPAAEATPAPEAAPAAEPAAAPEAPAEPQP